MKDLVARPLVEANAAAAQEIAGRTRRLQIAPLRLARAILSSLLWFQLVPAIGAIVTQAAHAAVPGAKGDGQLATPTVTIASGSKSLSVGSAIFSSTDVGKVLILAKAGAAPTSGAVETIAVTSAGAGYTSVPSCAVADGSGHGSGAACSYDRTGNKLARPVLVERLKEHANDYGATRATAVTVVVARGRNGCTSCPASDSGMPASMP